MNKEEHKKNQASMWVDYKHCHDGSMMLGIESDDKSLTFDGHFVMLFPKGEHEHDDTKAMERANEILKYLRGQKQIKRF